MKGTFSYTAIFFRMAKSYVFFKRAILLLFFCLLFSTTTKAQITVTPDAPGYCLGAEVTISYTGTWGPGSSWSTLFLGIIPIVITDQPSFQFTPVPFVFSEFVVEAFDASGLNPYTETIDVNSVLPPNGPGLNTQTPAGDICEGELVSATFDPGWGGVECSDEFQYITQTGGVASGPFSYTEGALVSTGGVEEVWIQGRRGNCNPNAGCSASAWVNLAHWNVDNDAVPPIITTCAPDRMLNVDADCELVVPDLTGEISYTDNCDLSPVLTQVPAAGTIVGTGVTAVIITVTDVGGNFASCTANITGIDDTPPEITGCPANISIMSDTSYCGAELNWTAPIATDNCPGLVLNSTHSPGDFFSIGITSVTYTATNDGGLTAQCSFDVEVQAAPDPLISGPDPVCTPGFATYSVTDPGSHSFLWTVSNGTIIGSDTSPQVDVEWTGTVQGTISVQVTSGSGCSVSNSYAVDKTQTPVTGIVNSSSSLIRR